MLRSHYHRFRGRYVVAALVFLLDLVILVTVAVAALATRALLAAQLAVRRLRRR